MGRASATRRPLVADVRLALLVAAAVALRRQRESVPLVEAARATLRAKVNTRSIGVIMAAP